MTAGTQRVGSGQAAAGRNADLQEQWHYARQALHVDRVRTDWQPVPLPSPLDSGSCLITPQPAHVHQAQDTAIQMIVQLK